MSKNDTDTEEDVMEAWKEGGGDERHTSEPATTDDSKDVLSALVEAYEEVLDGDASSNSTVRDANVAVLLRGLEEAGELGDVIADAREELDRDHNPAKNSRNDALKALVRLGLAEVRPDLMEVAAKAREEYETSKDYEF